ncbi:serine O-acetyltransferase [Metabacillus idriensis]|uniref:serine O-acetyltransferase n=1 Tax=Metabacillus idriensis TaxID=324768 RepID=UPI003D2911D1
MRSVYRIIRDDINHYSQNQKGIGKIIVIFYYQGLLGLILYRFLNYLFLQSKEKFFLKIIYNILFLILYIPFKNRTGLELHPEANIGRNLYIPHGNSVVLNKKVLIGNGVTIHQNTTLGINYRTEEAPTISDNVFIGTNCSIIGGIRVGKNATVLSNSAVVKDVDDYGIVGGVPAAKINKNM